jgi:hypothetical protein
MESYGSPAPLRCEPLVGNTYDLHYADPCFGQPKSILAKNFFDLRQCDMGALADVAAIERPNFQTGSLGSWAPRRTSSSSVNDVSELRLYLTPAQVPTDATIVG